MHYIAKFIFSLLSFATAIFLVFGISRFFSFTFLDEREGRFKTIDGLRGYLALSVFFHHFIVTWYWKINGAWANPPEVYYKNYGKVGVAIFFMISGFLFISKISKNKTNWLRLYESRFFRIVPLYAFSIIVITIITAHATNFRLNVKFASLAKQYLHWALFYGGNINDFSDTKKVIAGVEWSLRFEWIFYLSLPFLAYMIRRLKHFGSLTCIALTIALFLHPVKFASLSSSYLIMFTVGGVSVYLSDRLKICNNEIKRRRVSTIALVSIIGAIFYPYTFSFFHIALISLFFILVVLGNDMFGVLSSKSAILLGETSYSIYLLHGVVLYIVFSYPKIFEIKHLTLYAYLMRMPFLCAVVVIISLLTYICIERPCIRYGRKYSISNKLNLTIGITNKIKSSDSQKRLLY